MPKEKEDYFNNFWKFSRLILFHKARKINTVELPYSKIGPSQQNVYYKEVSESGSQNSPNPDFQALVCILVNAIGIVLFK